MLSKFILGKRVRAAPGASRIASPTEEADEAAECEERANGIPIFRPAWPCFASRYTAGTRALTIPIMRATGTTFRA